MRSFTVSLLHVAVVVAAFTAAVGCERSEAATKKDSGDFSSLTEIGDSSGERSPIRNSLIERAIALHAQGLNEPIGVRAFHAHRAAGDLAERAWRTAHRGDDARLAIDSFAAAAKSVDVEGVCEVAIRSAFIEAELASDAKALGQQLRALGREFSNRNAMTPACSNQIGRAAVALSAILPRESLRASSTPTAPTTRSAVVQKIEHWLTADAVRIVVTLDRSVGYRLREQGDAKRVLLELDGATAPTESRKLGGMVRELTIAPRREDLQVAMDLGEHSYRRAFHLIEPFRVIVDFARTKVNVSPRSVQRVVLDPGHGGTDPGAVGASGVAEKEVTLDIARRLAALLARDGIATGFTRESDDFVSLEERTQRANAQNADLFLSVHCNASEYPGRRGIETYTLDTSRDEIATMIAARENGTSRDANREIGSILANMRIADQSTRSLRFARFVQRGALASVADEYRGAVDGGVHRAAFYVLLGARMPSALFEANYLSNATEEQQLSNAGYRQRLAEGLANAVRAYKEGR